MWRSLSLMHSWSSCSLSSAAVARWQLAPILRTAVVRLGAFLRPDPFWIFDLHCHRQRMVLVGIQLEKLRQRPEADSKSAKSCTNDERIVDKLGHTSAISSAYARISAAGARRCSDRNNVSTASANKSGDSGQPCRMPAPILKPLCNPWPADTTHPCPQYRQRTKRQTEAGRPADAREAIKKWWDTEGKAA